MKRAFFFHTYFPNLLYSNNLNGALFGGKERPKETLQPATAVEVWGTADFTAGLP